MELNPEQLQAVESEEKRILVVASPGAGKTRTITHRIAHLVGARRVAPQSICAMTFTNKAAGEMRGRLEKMMRRHQVRKLTLGTFHSVCYRIIRSFGHLAGLKSTSLTIYDEFDQRDIMESCLKRLGSKISLTRAMEELEKASKTGHFEPPEDATLALPLQEYRSSLRAQNALDFNMILEKTSELLGHSEVVGYFQNRWRHILVDEAQDSSLVEHGILARISPDHLFLCGDIDQSIYEWRGANPTGLMQLAQDGFAVFRIEKCYRCPETVAEAANNVIKRNKMRYDKKIETSKTGPEITYLDFPENTQEYEAITVMIESEVVMGRRKPGDFFVLARTNWICDSFARIFVKKTPMKVQILSDEHSLWTVKSVKDIVHTLELICNPEATYAAERSVFARMLGRERLQALKTQCAWDEESLAQAVEKAAETDFCRRKTPDDDAFEVVMELLEETKYDKWLGEKARNHEAAAPGRLLDYLFEWRAAQDSSVSVATLIQFYWSRHAQDSLRLEENSVKVMTVHAAKGLEAPVVHLIGVREGVFPNRRSPLEEERRLFYVAMTRAQEQLVISWPGEPSPFIQESKS